MTIVLIFLYNFMAKCIYAIKCNISNGLLTMYLFIYFNLISFH